MLHTIHANTGCPRKQRGLSVTDTCAQVKVVVGIRNDAAEAYNISSIMGSVNSPADFKTYIHNLTHQVCSLETLCFAIALQVSLAQDTNPENHDI